MSNPERHYYVYIVASRTHILYIGITDNIERRLNSIAMRSYRASLRPTIAAVSCFWKPTSMYKKPLRGKNN
jgi:hypothetical protein